MRSVCDSAQHNRTTPGARVISGGSRNSRRGAVQGKKKSLAQNPIKKPGSSTQTHVLTMDSTGAGGMCSKDFKFNFQPLQTAQISFSSIPFQLFYCARLAIVGLDYSIL
jgi:hypothetical protein